MRKIYYAVILLTLMGSCRKPYNPPAVAAPGSYLVVEGVINAGSDSTIIKLSRTVKLSSGTTNNAETGAIVSIQSNASSSYPLTETSAGSYSAPSLNLDISKTYRLSIKTSNNQQYLSDYVVAKATPPIDSIGYTIQSNGIQLYVNAHDPNNNTHYYRWDYAETWQFHSKFESEFKTNGKAIVIRTPAQMVFNCFGNDINSNIVLGSSAKLSQDVIYQSPLTAVSSTSEKLETKYSILVNQYALTSDAYNFYINLKKNIEQLGSIFDAQPSEIAGNIHNINNAAEPVIGYVTACVIQSKRIFISNNQLPNTFVAVYPYECEEDSEYYSHPYSGTNDVFQNLIPINSTIVPTTSFTYGHSPSIAGFFGADIECVDCTLRGTTTQPSFWK